MGVSTRGHTDNPPPGRPNRPLRVARVVAGTGLLNVLAVFGNFLVLNRLIAPGDPVTTMTNIAGSPGLFRWGIASLLTGDRSDRSCRQVRHRPPVRPAHRRQQ